MPIERLVDVSRPALAVAADALAARLAGTDVATLHADAGQWATQARAVARLLGSSTAVVGATAVAMEASGVNAGRASSHADASAASPSPSFTATPRWTALLGALERLLADRAAGAVIVRLPGTAALARAHTGAVDDAALGASKDAAVQIVEAVCRSRPDLVLLDEDRALGAAALPSAYRKAWSTLRNVARYFDVPLGIAACGEPAVLAALARLQPDALFVHPRLDATLPPVDCLAPLARAGAALGVPIDLAHAADARARVASARAHLPAGTWLVTTAELSADVDVAPLRELVAELGTA